MLRGKESPAEGVRKLLDFIGGLSRGRAQRAL